MPLTLVTVTNRPRKGAKDLRMVHSIYDIARELGRLNPAQVDSSTAPNGAQTSGYKGHTTSGWHNVGHYDDGGNVGVVVLSIHPKDISQACERLRRLPDGVMSKMDFRSILRGLRIK